MVEFLFSFLTIYIFQDHDLRLFFTNLKSLEMTFKTNLQFLTFGTFKITPYFLC